MLGHVAAHEWLSAASIIVGATGAVVGLIWRALRKLARFEVEHRALMADLKARSEHIERATPGIVPLLETEQVKAIDGEAPRDPQKGEG